MKKINKNNLKIQCLNKATFSKGGVVLFFGLISFALVFGLFFQTAFVGAEDLEEEKEELEEKLEDLEKDAAKTQSEINQVNSQINQTQSAIYSTSQVIAKYEKEIAETTSEIEKKQKNIEFKQQLLGEYLRLFRRNSVELGFITYDSKRDLGEYLREIENFEDFQVKIKDALETIKKEKEEIEGKKEQVENKKEEKEDVLATQEQQKENLEYLENEKQAILSETNLSISEIKSDLAKINRKLNAFLDEDFDMDDLIDAVGEAEDETGVRKEFIFAMLDKETDLGRFTGGCRYSEVKDHMKDADRDVFKDLMDELGYDKNEKKLSCWPGYGYGGAMGIAQFMPTTWIGYKDDIAKKTGHNPPNPWRLEDGVMGMALKLKKAGADSKKKEHYAAKVYYCGGPSSPYWDTKCEAYADTVISWSKGYDEYFD